MVLVPRTVRLGLIGVGRWGRVVLSTLSELEGVDVAYVAGRRPLVDVPLPADRVLRDWRTLLTKPDLDGVLVCSSPETHAEIVCATLQQDKAVFVEKPLAVTVAEASRILELARHRSGVVHVDHIDLFNPAWHAVVQALKHCGPIRRLEAEFGGVVPAQHTVPPLWDWGPHPVALVLSLLGPPVTVAARRSPGAACGTELLRMELTFETGASAEIVIGDGFPTRRRRVIVHADAATLVYDDNGTEKAARCVGGRRETLPFAGVRPLTAALRRFVAAIHSGAPDVDDVELGLDVVRLLESVDSMQPGK